MTFHLRQRLGGDESLAGVLHTSMRVDSEGKPTEALESKLANASVGLPSLSKLANASVGLPSLSTSSAILQTTTSSFEINTFTQILLTFCTVCLNPATGLRLLWI